MPVLSNSRHERFAQEVAQGKSASEAFVLAGYSANGSNATRLNQNEAVRNRVEELQRIGAERAGITIERIVNGLVDIADGVEAKDSDKIRAFELLGKHLGMFKDKVEHSGELSVFSFKLDRANGNSGSED